MMMSVVHITRHGQWKHGNLKPAVAPDRDRVMVGGAEGWEECHCVTCLAVYV